MAVRRSTPVRALTQTVRACTCRTATARVSRLSDHLRGLSRGRTTRFTFAGGRTSSARSTRCSISSTLPRRARLVVSGGSAGGLSTYLHVDHIADRLRAAQSQPPHQPPHQPLAKVAARPVAGFFIDGPRFDPTQRKYADDVRYGVSMFNSTPPLSAACKAAYAGEEWRCWMAPFAAPFVRERVFAVQSRFDEFQLMSLLALPCMQGMPFTPPYPPANCSAAEDDAVVAFGARLLAQMQPFLDAKPESGIWLVSCIQHDVNCDMRNVTEEDAFTELARWWCAWPRLWLPLA